MLASQRQGPKFFSFDDDDDDDEDEETPANACLYLT